MNHECVLELLKLSSNANECKPLGGGSVRDVLTTSGSPLNEVGRCRLTLSNQIESAWN